MEADAASFGSGGGEAVHSFRFGKRGRILIIEEGAKKIKASRGCSFKNLEFAASKRVWLTGGRGKCSEFSFSR